MFRRRCVVSIGFTIASVLVAAAPAAAQAPHGSRPFVELGGRFPNSCSFFNAPGTIGVNPGITGVRTIYPGGQVVRARVHYFRFSHYEWLPASPRTSNWWYGDVRPNAETILWHERLPNGSIGRLNLISPNWIQYFYAPPGTGGRFTVIVEFEWLDPVTHRPVAMVPVQATGVCQVAR